MAGDDDERVHDADAEGEDDRDQRGGVHRGLSWSGRHGFVSATKIQKDAELLPLVFPALNGALRDPRNTQRQWRRVRVALGLDWVVTHTYRKTTATSIKEAGLDDLAASDQLGHAHVSMTQNIYYGRNKIRREVADVLDRNIG